MEGHLRVKQKNEFTFTFLPQFPIQSHIVDKKTISENATWIIIPTGYMLKFPAHNDTNLICVFFTILAGISCRSLLNLHNCFKKCLTNQFIYLLSGS